MNIKDSDHLDKENSLGDMFVRKFSLGNLSKTNPIFM